MNPLTIWIASLTKRRNVASTVTNGGISPYHAQVASNPKTNIAMSSMAKCLIAHHHRRQPQRQHLQLLHPAQQQHHPRYHRHPVLIRIIRSHPTTVHQPNLIKHKQHQQQNRSHHHHHRSPPLRPITGNVTRWIRIKVTMKRIYRQTLIEAVGHRHQHYSCLFVTPNSPKHKRNKNEANRNDDFYNSVICIKYCFNYLYYI